MQIGKSMLPVNVIYLFFHFSYESNYDMSRISHLELVPGYEIEKGTKNIYIKKNITIH